MVIGSTANSLFGLLKAFSTNYYMFMLVNIDHFYYIINQTSLNTTNNCFFKFQFEFLDSAAGTCTYMAAFVLGVEWVSSKYRVLSCTVISLFYPVGEIILGLLAMYIPVMRTLLLAVYIPGLIVITYYWLVPESVRWLLITGRVERARELLRKAAKANNKVLSKEAEEIIGEKAAEAQLLKEQESTNGISIVSIFKSRILIIRWLVCSVCWIICYLAFYGLALSATVIHGDGNKYLSFIVVVIAELPGALFTYSLLDRFGRKATLSSALLLGGTIILCSQLIPDDQTVLTRVFFFVGMCSVSCAFTTTYIFTAEIWPTSTRNTMMNICSTIGRFGAMAAPLTILLVK